MTTRMWKDMAALGVTVLAVLTFAATHNGWNVWLIGDNHHAAAAVMLALGVIGCSLGDPAASGKPGAMWMTILGVVALATGVIGIVTGSLTAMSVLAIDMACLWAIATVRHADLHAGQRPIAH